MKRLLIVCIAAILILSSCSSEKDFYGVWYYEDNGNRDVIQFSESKDGQNAFVWAVYDIEKDEIVSVANGYYNSDGNQIVLTYLEGDTELVLNYTLDGDKLTLNSESASIVLTKYELE